MNPRIRPVSLPVWTALLFGSALTLGCASKTPPEPETPPPAEKPAATPAPAQSEKPGDDPTQSDINISDAIRKACGLTDTEAHFAFNSADVRESDRDLLKKIATCFATGPLKGKTMLLVGHADPRGEDEYNMVLGGRRSDNVGAAMIDAGLPEKQLETSSRGELDAVGTDEATWSKDRRVDVMLSDEG
jgi:peptidoglycan-associated lipoprotein